MSRARRVVRGMLIAVGIALIATVVVAVAFFLFLFTSPGEDLLRSFAVSRINERIVGQLEIADLEFRGGEIELESVGLRTAQGDRVLFADRVLADLALGSFVLGELHLERLVVSDYGLDLIEQDDGDWNLAAALQRTRPEPPGPRWPIIVDRFQFLDGVLAARAEAGGQMQTLRVIDLDAAGEISVRDGLARGALEMRGQVEDPIAGPMTVEARARVEGDAQVVKVEAQIGRGELEGQLWLPGLRDPAGLRLAEVEGWARVELPAFTVAGFTYGPVRFGARIDDGHLELRTADVELPGATLTGRSEGGDSAFVGTLSIDALGTTARALEALLGIELPDVSGRGKLDLRIGNPIDAAGVRIGGRLSRVGVGDTRAEGVEIDATIADITRLREGEIVVGADAVQVGDRHVRGVRLDALVQDREIAVDARVEAPYSAELHLQGELTNSYRGLRVHELSLSYSDTRWTNEAPATVRLQDAGVVVQGVDLVSNGQRIEVNATWTDGRIQGEAAARLFSGDVRARFDLPASGSPAQDQRVGAEVDVQDVALNEAWQALEDRLPPDLVDRVERISGRVSLSAHIGGTWPSPDIDGRLAIRDGFVALDEIGRYRDIDLVVQAEGDRLRLETLEARGGGGSVTATGSAVRAGDDLRFRYRLRIDADRFPVPLEDPVSATFVAQLQGIVSPERITSDVQLENVRVFRRERGAGTEQGAARGSAF